MGVKLINIPKIAKLKDIRYEISNNVANFPIIHFYANSNYYHKMGFFIKSKENVIELTIDIFYSNDGQILEETLYFCRRLFKFINKNKIATYTHTTQYYLQKLPGLIIHFNNINPEILIQII